MYSWDIGPWTNYAREHIYVVSIPGCGPGFWFADALEFT